MVRGPAHHKGHLTGRGRLLRGHHGVQGVPHREERDGLRVHPLEQYGMRLATPRMLSVQVFLDNARKGKNEPPKHSLCIGVVVSASPFFVRGHHTFCTGAPEVIHLAFQIGLCHNHKSVHLLKICYWS